MHLVISILTACALYSADVPERMVMGMNFAGISDWGTEHVWKDLMKQSRSWAPQRPGADWGQGWPLAVDSLNWITSLDAGQTADCPLFGSTSENWTSMDTAYTYVCTWDGTGTVSLSNTAELTHVNANRIEFRNRPGTAPFLAVTATTPGDYIRNIRVFRSDHEDSLAAEPWDARFMQRWREFPVIRFMDWGSTNGSPVRTWSGRTRPNSQTQASGAGVALEHMIDYCNRTGSDPWFCIPHMADDDYVRRYATMVRDSLDPSLTAYVEYSNEVWNSIFSQTHYADSMGLALSLSDSAHPWECGWRYSGLRSGEIFDIWEDVFGGTDRFVRVVASQMNLYVSEQKLMVDSVFKKTDALAVAPYFGGELSFDLLDSIATWSVDRILDSCLADIRGPVRDNLQAHIDYLDGLNTANGSNLRLIAYEGGQHLTAWGMNQTVTDLFTAANRSDRMYDLYIEYFEQWQELGGTVFANFSSVGTFGQFGAWGVLEYADQDPADAPKYRALLEMIRRYPATVSNNRNTPVPGTVVPPASPNPFRHAVRLRAPGAVGEASFRIYDGQGILVRTLCSAGISVLWDGRDDAGRLLPEGTYVFRAGDGDAGGRVVLVR